MALGPERFVQRCAVLGASGEAATLTFNLQKEERLEPSYRSISVVRFHTDAHQTTLHHKQGSADSRKGLRKS